jgi:lysophospholipid acyltransferase (LPLAT)-like uncharacterized protein
VSEEKRSRRDWKLSVTVGLGALVIRALASTWRYRVTNADGMRALRSRRQPFIFAFWHGTMLPLVWLHRGEGVPVVISEHRDGEIIARIVERFGFTTIRGSTTRGAARALLGIVRELEAGSEVAVTPDGPRGPARKFASGALVAAQRVGVPIVCIGVSASRAWRLKSWDSFMIPKPFSRVCIAYAVPTCVSATSARAAEEEAPRFEALMSEALNDAQRA